MISFFVACCEMKVQVQHLAPKSETKIVSGRSSRRPNLDQFVPLGMVDESPVPLDFTWSFSCISRVASSWKYV